MRAHPTPLEIIGCCLMGKYMHKEPPLGFQCTCYLRQQEFVVLHVLEKFDGDHTIESIFLKLEVYHVPSNNIEVRETLRVCLLINICFLSPRVRECRNPGIWKDLGKIERSRAPAAASMAMLAIAAIS